MRVEGAISWRKTPWGEEPFCPHCGSDVHWVDCENCDEGYTGHDCGEDCCCCLYPEPNVVCDICDGKGGWYVCLSEECAKEQTVNRQPIKEESKHVP